MLSIPPVAAQMCTPGKGFKERLLDWQFVEAGVCQYADSMGFYVFGMVFYSAILISIYITTRSPVLPGILLLTTGAAVLGQVAAPAIPFVALLIVLNGAGVLAYLYLRVGSNY